MEKSYVYLWEQTQIRIKEWDDKISVVRWDIIHSTLPEKHFLSNGFAKVWASSIDEYKVKVEAIDNRKQDIINREIQENEIAKIEYMKKLNDIKVKYEIEKDRLNKEEELLLWQKEIFENSLNSEIECLEKKQKEIKEQIAKMQSKKEEVKKEVVEKKIYNFQKKKK